MAVVVGWAAGAQPARAAVAGGKALVAHRGASAYAPEHTLAAYTLALEQGADYVEQDLAVTKDGVLVCIHDLTLERTTDVEAVFPTRFSEDTSGPTPVKRWLVHDFTLAEIRQLDAGSWFATTFAGAKIPTFQEAIDLLQGKAGMYPELKDPAFYRERGVKPEELLAALMKKNNLIDDPKTPVIIQSFDADTVKALAKTLPQVPRVFLVAPDAMRRSTPRQGEGSRHVGDRPGAEQGDPRRAARDRGLGACREDDGDAVDVPREGPGEVPSLTRRDVEVPLHPRRRRVVHRQPRPVPATLTAPDVVHGVSRVARDAR